MGVAVQVAVRGQKKNRDRSGEIGFWVFSPVLVPFLAVLIVASVVVWVLLSLLSAGLVPFPWESGDKS